jgi:hypothetical protein
MTFNTLRVYLQNIGTQFYENDDNNNVLTNCPRTQKRRETFVVECNTNSNTIKIRLAPKAFPKNNTAVPIHTHHVPY